MQKNQIEVHIISTQRGLSRWKQKSDWNVHFLNATWTLRNFLRRKTRIRTKRMEFFTYIVHKVLTIRLFLNKYNIFQYIVGHMHSCKHQLRVAYDGMRVGCWVESAKQVFLKNYKCQSAQTRHVWWCKEFKYNHGQHMISLREN